MRSFLLSTALSIAFVAVAFILYDAKLDRAHYLAIVGLFYGVSATIDNTAHTRRLRRIERHLGFRED